MKVLLGAILFCFMVIAKATPILPVEVDDFRIAFVTSGALTAVSPDIDVYNNFVREHASGSELENLLIEAGASPNWFAWGSTVTVNAIDNISSDGNDDLPIYNSRGELVAENWDHLLFNTATRLTNAIKYDENGDLRLGSVFTGSNRIGERNSSTSCLGCSSIVGGKIDNVSSWNSSFSNGRIDPFHYLPFYAFSSPIHLERSIDIPEPSTFLLILFGWIMFGYRLNIKIR